MKRRPVLYIKIQLALLSSACLLITSLQMSQAASTIEKSLHDAKILPPQYAYRVTQKGAEALVRTYERPMATEADVKIDSVLIGRIVTEKNPDIAKVKTQFFTHDRTSYIQVIVTVGDIKAFGAGDISKEKLLQSLELLRISTSEPNARTASSASSAQRSRDPNQQSTQKAGRFNGDGLSFIYPQSWTFVPPNAGNNDQHLGELTGLGGREWASVIIRKQSADTPDQQAAFDEDYSLRNSHAVTRKGALSVGRHREDGFQLLTSGVENNRKDKPRMQQHVYFGPPGEIYSLTLQYSPLDASLSSEFVKVLNTIELVRR